MRCILFSLLFVPCVFFCQTGTIQILDKESKDALPGVNIVFGQSGGITDIDGTFTFSSPDFPTTVVFSYVGYNNLELKVDRIEELPAVVYLQPSNSVLDQVTITGAKYEQNVTRSSVTVDIIKPDLLRSVNSVSSDKILNKVPGVQMLDGQANIRGGSGYSYGAGSRVMMLLDGIPALQPDAGFPNWGDIPIENLSQVEILKGAASTLYGSAALNGIINFRSSYATSEPETRFSAATSVSLSPKDKAKKWWGDTLRYETNFTAVHKQKFGNLDFIASGLYNKLEGFNQFTNESRGRANVNLRYRKTDRLVFGGGVGSNIQIHTVGFAPFSFFVFEQLYDENGRLLEGQYADRNGDGIVNDKDKYRFEKAAPDYLFGITSNLSIGKLDFSFAGRANIGNFVYNNVATDMGYLNRLYHPTNYLSNVHRSAVENNVSDQAKVTFSDHFVTDASFFRIDHITAGYTFDKLLGVVMRLYATVQNQLNQVLPL